MNFNDDFLQKIEKIYGITEHVIAKEFLDLKDGKINVATDKDFSYLGLSKQTPRKVSYITQERLDRFPIYQDADEHWKVGDYYKDSKVTKWDDEYYYLENGDIHRKHWMFDNYYRNQPRIRYHTSMAKIIKWCFGDKFTEKVCGEFISHWYAETLNIKESNFKIDSHVSKWYHESMHFTSGGQLGHSCMRYDKCQDYLKFYDDNSVCKIVLLLSDCGKVKARAMLWDDKYFDRVYGLSNELQDAFRVYLKQKNYHDIYMNSKSVTLDVEVGAGDRETFPYCDTFHYLSDTQISTDSDLNYDRVLNENENGNVESSRCQGCEDGYDSDNLYYCEDTDDDRCSDCCVYIELGEYENSRISDGNARYIERHRNYAYYEDCTELHGQWELDEDIVTDCNGNQQIREDCVYSDYLEEYILEDEAVFSNPDNTWLEQSNCFEEDGEYFIEEPIKDEI